MTCAHVRYSSNRHVVYTHVTCHIRESQQNQISRNINKLAQNLTNVNNEIIGTRII
jgi:hypothetical protein